MSLGFISDIHGNYDGLRAVLAALDDLGIKKIFCAGDVVGYYTQVNECCAELIARNIACVMGNHDWYMASGGMCLRSTSVNECLDYQRRIISDDHLRWIRSLPVQICYDDFHIVHGGWADPIDEYLKPTPEYFYGIKGRHFVSGHTHIQTLMTCGDKTYCNPGSVGQPRDGDSRAAFATYDGSTFELHRVEYDSRKVFDLMRRAGIKNYYRGSL